MVTPMTPEERLRAIQKERANSDNVVEFTAPTKEERDAMELQEEILEEFGPTGLFCMQIVSSVFGELSDRIDQLESRLDADG